VFSLFSRPDVEKKEIKYLQIPHENITYKIIVRRNPRAKRLTLKIARSSGDICLTLPLRASLSTGKTFVENHVGWIAARLEKRLEHVYFAPDMMFPLRGVMMQIKHRPKVVGGIAVEIESEEHTPCLWVGGDPVHLPRRVRDYLKKQAHHDLAQAVKYYETKSGLKSQGITLRDTSSRWGSCSSRGQLNFSWRLIMAPPYVLDYLAAHEVTHLKEMNHSTRYWSLLKSLCNHTDEAEAWLKKHGASLHRYQTPS
jgi:predicted metal-dependent hydrolase